MIVSEVPASVALIYNPGPFLPRRPAGARAACMGRASSRQRISVAEYQEAPEIRDVSAFKNDPSGLKQKSATAILLAAGVALLLFTGTGAVIDCNESCVLQRREIFHKSEERFSRAGFSGVRTTVESMSNTQGRRGAASTNLFIEADGREFPVFASSVGWVFGPMTYANVEEARKGSAPFKISGTSLGGVSLILSVTLSLIGLMFVIMTVAVPISQGMAESDLAVARRTNLLRLSVVLLGAAAFWTGFLFWFVRFLSQA